MQIQFQKCINLFVLICDGELNPPRKKNCTEKRYRSSLSTSTISIYILFLYNLRTIFFLIFICILVNHFKIYSTYNRISSVICAWFFNL